MYTVQLHTIEPQWKEGRIVRFSVGHLLGGWGLQDRFHRHGVGMGRV